MQRSILSLSTRGVGASSAMQAILKVFATEGSSPVWSNGQGKEEITSQANGHVKTAIGEMEEVVSKVAAYVTAIYADAHATCSTRCHCGYKQKHKQRASSAETTKNKPGLANLLCFLNCTQRCVPS